MGVSCVVYTVLTFAHNVPITPCFKASVVSLSPLTTLRDRNTGHQNFTHGSIALVFLTADSASASARHGARLTRTFADFFGVLSDATLALEYGAV